MVKTATNWANQDLDGNVASSLPVRESADYVGAGDDPYVSMQGSLQPSAKNPFERRHNSYQDSRSGTSQGGRGAASANTSYLSVNES